MDSNDSKRSQISKQLLSLADQRGNDKTFCPSEVARIVAPENWRELMDTVRDVATTLIDEGKLVCKQRGEVVEIREAIGPIRLQQSSR